MRRRVLGAVVGVAVAVGLLASLGRPTPRVRLELPGSQPDSRIDLAQAEATGPISRWAFVQDMEHHQGWAFDHHTGRVAGPWPVPNFRRYVCDAAGHLYAHAGKGTAVNGFPLTVWRVDPEAGVFTPHYEFPDRLHITPTVWNGEPAWLTFAGDPLRVEVIDLATGAVRRRLELPGRTGDLIDNGGPFAGDTAVSADGRWLAFGEAWDGLRRTTPPGIELWDLASGRLARRIDYPPADPARGGCSSLRFAGNHLRFVSVVRHKPDDFVIRLPAARWQVRVPDGPCEPDPVGERPNIPDLHLEYQPDDAIHGRRLYLGRVSRDDDTTTFVVVDDDLRPLHRPWVLPASFDDYADGLLRLRLAADGEGVLVASKRPDGPSADWLRTPLTWVGLPPYRLIDRLDWYDWRTGESWRVGSYPGRATDVACQPGGVVVLAQEWATGRTTLEVWPDPPGRGPAWWAWVLAAVGGGVLGGQAGLRSGYRGGGIIAAAGPSTESEHDRRQTGHLGRAAGDPPGRCR